MWRQRWRRRWRILFLTFGWRKSEEAEVAAGSDRRARRRRPLQMYTPIGVNIRASIGTDKRIGGDARRSLPTYARRSASTRARRSVADLRASISVDKCTPSEVDVGAIRPTFRWNPSSDECGSSRPNSIKFGRHKRLRQKAFPVSAIYTSGENPITFSDRFRN